MARLHRRLEPGAPFVAAHFSIPQGRDEAILRGAGFSNLSLFYAGFTFRGGVGNA